MKITIQVNSFLNSQSVTLNRENENKNYTDGDSTTTAEVARMVNLWVWERRRRGRNWDLVKRWGHLGNCIREAAVVAETAIVVEWRIRKIS